MQKAKIVAVLNTKGGVGKSTTAVNVAAELSRSGERVLFVDGDNQASAYGALTLRADSGLQPIAAVSYPEGKVMRQQVQLQLDNYDRIIIDAGGKDSTSLRAALMLADVVLIPCQPSSFDIWGTGDMVTLIRQANEQRDGLVCYAFLSVADTIPNSRDNADSLAQLREFPELIVLDTPLSHRKAYPRAASFGMSVFETMPAHERDSKAMAELAALMAVLN